MSTNNDLVDLAFEDGAADLEVSRGDLYDVARAFGFDPEHCGPDNIVLETVKAVALAHHLIGLKPHQYRDVGLALAQRQDTWREFDSARRLGAKTEELQRILIAGLYQRGSEARNLKRRQ